MSRTRTVLMVLLLCVTALAGCVDSAEVSYDFKDTNEAHTTASVTLNEMGSQFIFNTHDEDDDDTINETEAENLQTWVEEKMKNGSNDEDDDESPTLNGHEPVSRTLHTISTNAEGDYEDKLLTFTIEATLHYPKTDADTLTFTIPFSEVNETDVSIDASPPPGYEMVETEGVNDEGAVMGEQATFVFEKEGFFLSSMVSDAYEASPVLSLGGLAASVFVTMYGGMWWLNRRLSGA